MCTDRAAAVRGPGLLGSRLPDSEDDVLDELVAGWIRQAAKLPGWSP